MSKDSNLIFQRRGLWHARTSRNWDYAGELALPRVVNFTSKFKGTMQFNDLWRGKTLKCTALKYLIFLPR